MENNLNPKPLYIIIAENPLIKEGFSYYATQSFTESSVCIDFRGQSLTKVKAEKIIGLKITLENAHVYENIKIPWSRVIRLENISYKNHAIQKLQGE